MSHSHTSYCGSNLRPCLEVLEHQDVRLRRRIWWGRRSSGRGSECRFQPDGYTHIVMWYGSFSQGMEYGDSGTEECNTGIIQVSEKCQKVSPV